MQGGTLTIGVQTLNNTDPQQVGNNDQIALARQLVAGLTIADPDSGEIHPWIASSWDINDNATEFTFHLRDDATFHDGTPIDAEAVKANFDSILAQATELSGPAGYLKGATTTVVDSATATVSFESPNAQFLEATSNFRLGLISTASTELSIEDRLNGKFVGSGPFQLESFELNTEATLVRYEDYQLDNEVHSNPGAAYLDSIVFKAIPENGVRTGSLRTGDIDVATFLTSPELASFETDGFEVIRRANPGVVYRLTPYLEQPILQDVRVRQAIQKAIDRDSITAVIYGDSQNPPSSVLAETTPLTTDLSALLVRDVEGAKALLDEAGWAEGADGIREKDGQKLHLSFVFYQEQDPVLLVQTQLREVGIDLEVKQVPSSELSGARDTGNYHFSYGNTTRNEPDQLRNSYEAEFAKILALGLDPTTQVPGAAEIAQLLQDQAGITDSAERTAVIEQAQTLILENGYAFPVYQLVSGIALSEQVQDLKFAADSRLDFTDTWLTQ